MTHDTKNFIDMAEHTKQNQHLEGKIQKKIKKRKKEMIQEKEAIKLIVMLKENSKR